MRPTPSLVVVPERLVRAGGLWWRRKLRTVAGRVPGPAVSSRGDAVRAAFRRAKCVPLPAGLRRRLSGLRVRPGTLLVPIERLLLGDENGMTASEYSRRNGDLLRSSTPIARWPHVELLQAHASEGDAALAPDRLAASSYVASARRCVAATGHYFGATSEREIHAVAGDFVRRFRGIPVPPRRSQSPVGAPICVRRVRRSDCYQVVDGHHRLAAAYARGERHTEVVVERRRVSTPLQRVLDQMSWLEGKRELYQPLPAPEIARDWVLVRRCTDRLAKMRAFLDERAPSTPGRQSYLDVASAYGWFVAEMSALGFDAHGIERDPLGAVLAENVYGVEPKRIQVGDCVPLLEAVGEPYDIVSCFSLLHHFVLGRGSCPPERLAELLDRSTRSVLFLDTGQGSEEWFHRALPDWDEAFIEAWLRKHTSFTEIIPLGRDDDRRPPFEGNYGRMLFACVRSGNA